MSISATKLQISDFCVLPEICFNFLLIISDCVYITLNVYIFFTVAAMSDRFTVSQVDKKLENYLKDAKNRTTKREGNIKKMKLLISDSGSSSD